uniref:Uncharacterized protein n=1 Tax=Leersia perrieri TaxID=77586 RepID=A0A0D9WDY5_9ORYZ
MQLLDAVWRLVDRLLENVACAHPWDEQTPWIGVLIHWMHASMICVIIGDHMLTVDMDRREKPLHGTVFLP